MNYLNILNTKRSLSKELDVVKLLSEKIDHKLSKSKITDDSKLEKLTFEELQDLNKILGLTNFLLCKYEEKKETRSILQYFVSIITESTQAIQGLDDDISELIISAEDSINKIKDMHVHISEKSNLDNDSKQNFSQEDECGSINLTNFTTEINTVGYQQNFQEESVQVI
ncbi:MAG: hypothetical protein OEM18_07685 [Nitrosopumilus sp.]|jgi:hypothetical protein|nr:hypothetical protein [Nitrosopumilus sp.]MDH3502240.1 hypothetical protein [Nitrosopumilus sp.]